jgi:endoglucanase
MTGFGSVSPLYTHHRQCKADDIPAPIPGYVVGGANKDTSGADISLQDIILSGTSPAKCYTDVFRLSIQ